jgi:DnaK suppressor protein
MLTQDELNDFKTKLLNRKEKININLQGTSLELRDMRTQELNDEGDHASLSAETIVDSAILEQQESELGEIELALDKIKKNTYGICEMCEEPIGIARLEVKNFARFCITCREITEKEHN